MLYAFIDHESYNSQYDLFKKIWEMGIWIHNYLAYKHCLGHISYIRVDILVASHCDALLSLFG